MLALISKPMVNNLSKIVKRISYNTVEEEYDVDSFQRENYTIFVNLDNYPSN
jgi:hypothetical protein